MLSRSASAQAGANPAHARVHEGAGAGQLDQEHFVGLAVPSPPRAMSEVAPGQEPRLVVVGPEIGGAGMGNVDGDERDAGFQVLGGDLGSDGLVGLELDHEVDVFAHELLGVLERDLRLIAVVEDDQLDVFGFGGALEALVHLAGEGDVLSLGGVADAVPPATPDLGDQTETARVHLLQEAAVMEGVEEAKAHPLAEARPDHDVAQAQRLAGGLERAQDLGGMHHGLDDVRLRDPRRHGAPLRLFRRA